MNKKLFLAFTVLVILFAACTKKDEIKPEVKIVSSILQDESVRVPFDSTSTDSVWLRVPPTYPETLKAYRWIDPNDTNCIIVHTIDVFMGDTTETDLVSFREALKLASLLNKKLPDRQDLYEYKNEIEESPLIIKSEIFAGIYQYSKKVFHGQYVERSALYMEAECYGYWSKTGLDESFFSTIELNENNLYEIRHYIGVPECLRKAIAGLSPLPPDNYNILMEVRFRK